MKNKIILASLFAAILCVSACEYDNYDAPNALFSGSLLYNGKALPFDARTARSPFLFYQSGYPLEDTAYDIRYRLPCSCYQKDMDICAPDHHCQHCCRSQWFHQSPEFRLPERHGFGFCPCCQLPKSLPYTYGHSGLLQGWYPVGHQLRYPVVV